MAALTASRPTITLPNWTTPRVSFERPSADKGEGMKSRPPGTQSRSASRSEPYETTQNRGRRDRPCDACRRRKTRCAMEEGAQNCSLCKMQGQTCTFVENPLPRKRRSISGALDAEDIKRRQVTAESTSIRSIFEADSRAVYIQGLYFVCEAAAAAATARIYISILFARGRSSSRRESQV